MGIAEYRKLENLLEFLLNELASIRKRYLLEGNKIPYELKSNIQEHDIKSFVLLTHAAFENYLEALSILTAKISLKLFREKNIINKVTLSFAALELERPKFSEDSWHHEKNESVNLQSLLISQMSKFSSALNETNHGMKNKNLNKLLRPVGIDLPKDTLLEIALSELCNVRGKYAHRFLQKFTDVDSSVQKIEHNENPQSLLQTSSDVQRLMMKLHRSALLSIFSFDTQLAQSLMRLHFFKIMNRLDIKSDDHEQINDVFKI